jgi:hypothetical protein
MGVGPHGGGAHQQQGQGALLQILPDAAGGGYQGQDGQHQAHRHLMEELEAEGGGGAFEVHHHGLEAQGQQDGHHGQGREESTPGAGGCGGR